MRQKEVFYSVQEGGNRIFKIRISWLAFLYLISLCSCVCIICSTNVLSISSTSDNYLPFCVRKAAGLVEMTLLMSKATLLIFPVKRELKSRISVVVMRLLSCRFTLCFHISLQLNMKLRQPLKPWLHLSPANRARLCSYWEKLKSNHMYLFVHNFYYHL